MTTYVLKYSWVDNIDSQIVNFEQYFLVWFEVELLFLAKVIPNPFGAHGICYTPPPKTCST